MCKQPALINFDLLSCLLDYHDLGISLFEAALLGLDLEEPVLIRELYSLGGLILAFFYQLVE